MTYKEVALSCQLSGTFHCAAFVTARTAAVDTSHHSVASRRVVGRGPNVVVRDEEAERSSRRSRSPSVTVFAVAGGNEAAPSGQLCASPPVPVEELRCSLWTATGSGDIEVRSESQPDQVLYCVSRKPRATVISLIQTGGNRVVAGLSDGYIRVFDALTLCEYKQVRAHSAAVRCLAAVANSVVHRSEQEGGCGCAPLFLTASSDRTIAKWDAVSLQCLCRLKGHMYSISALTSTLNGAYVFSGADDGSLHMWSMVDNTQVAGRSIANPKTVAKKKRTAKDASVQIVSQQKLQLPKFGLDDAKVKRTKQSVAHEVFQLATPKCRSGRSASVGAAKDRQPPRSPSTANPHGNWLREGATKRSCSLALVRGHGVLPKMNWGKGVMSPCTSVRLPNTSVRDCSGGDLGGDDESVDTEQVVTEERAVSVGRDGSTAFCRSGVNAPREGKKGRSKLKKKVLQQVQVSQYPDVLRQLWSPVSDSAVSRQLAALYPDVGAHSGEGGTLLWPLKGEHTKRITHLVVAWDRLLLSGSADGEVKILSLPSGRVVRTVHKGSAPVTGMALDGVRCLLWIATADGGFHVYNMLTPTLQQLHAWRDLSTPRPLLVPVAPRCTLCQLFLLAAPEGKKKLSNGRGAYGKAKPKINLGNRDTNPWPKKAGEVAPTERETQPMSLQSEETIQAPPKSKVTCIQVDDGDDEALTDVGLLRQLDAAHKGARSRMNKIEPKQEVFRRILRRQVPDDVVELDNLTAKEQARAASAIYTTMFHFVLGGLFKRWMDWTARRVLRYQCARRIRFLASVNQESVLGRYFRRWRHQHTAQRIAEEGRGIRLLEARSCGQLWRPHDSNYNLTLSRKIGVVLESAWRRRLLHQYYRYWFHHFVDSRRVVSRAVAFNRLLLSFDTKLSDRTFVFRRLAVTNRCRQRRAWLLRLLEQRMEVHYRKLQQHCIQKWLSFVRDRRESRQSYDLVETLASVLVDVDVLRMRAYFKWYRFSLFETKLQRFDEERATLQREWIVVQNAVESKDSVTDLQEERAQLEVEIAQLAYERDEIDSQNVALRADIVHMQMCRSLDCILAGYTDAEDKLKVVPRLFSEPPLHNRRLTNINGDRRSSVSEDDGSAEAVLLGQVSAVLRALKATVLRCRRHCAAITTAHERVVRIPIWDKPVETREWSSGVSHSSVGGDSSLLHGTSAASLSDTRYSSERRRSITSLISTVAYLADEFDRVVVRLQSLVIETARQAGADLDETSNRVIHSLLKRKNSKSAADIEEQPEGAGCHSLEWLKFVPPARRAEILPLLVDLVMMYDSFRAHSDTEVEAGSKTLSTRGILTSAPLSLRSLCRVQGAMWLVRHSAVLLELMSPGTWDKHLAIWFLADSLRDSVAFFNQNQEAGLATPKRTRGKETADEAKDTSSILSDTSFQSPVSAPKDKRKRPPKVVGGGRVTPRRPASVASQVTPHRSVECTPANIWTSPKPETAHLQRKLAISCSNIPAAVNRSARERLEGEFVVHTAQRSSSVPLRQPSAIPSARPGASTALTRPYLGFRVAVGRDDQGCTTLSIQEVSRSYIGCSGDTELVGPAFAAGLREGDQLVRFAGYTVTELAAFNTVVARHVRPSASIPVVFSRNGAMMSATIVVGEKKRE